MAKLPRTGYTKLMEGANAILTLMEVAGHVTRHERLTLETETQRVIEELDYTGGKSYVTADMAAIGLACENLKKKGFGKRIGPYQLGEPAYFHDFLDVPTRAIHRTLREFKNDYIGVTQRKATH